MPEITAWYIPDRPRGFWVVRSAAGKLWAFPNVARAWTHGLRFRVEWEPTGDPLPHYQTVKLAWLLGLPGATEPSERDLLYALGEECELMRDLEREEVPA